MLLMPCRLVLQIFAHNRFTRPNFSVVSVRGQGWFLQIGGWVFFGGRRESHCNEQTNRAIARVARDLRNMTVIYVKSSRRISAYIPV